MGHVALVAHACADAGAVVHAERLLGLLAPYAGYLACIGQIGTLGPVDLATGRLHALLGRTAEARELLGRAREQAARNGGLPSVRRCDEALAALPD